MGTGIRTLFTVEEANQVLPLVRSVVRDVVNAYWALAYAIRDIEIRKSSLTLAQERLRITKAGISAGSIAPTEALAVEQIIATREEEIIAAEVGVSQRSLELRRLAGMEIGPGAIDLDIVAPLTVEAREFATEELLERAYQNSPDLARLAAAQASADIDVEVAADQRDPRLDASIDFGPLGIHTGFTRAARRTVEFDDYSLTANLNYEQALGNRGAKGAHRQARVNLQRTKISLADARVDIAMAMIQAIQSARAADKRMLISERAIVLAEKNIDAEKARFELGRSTNFDIAQRQDELKRAQLLYARAAADYLSAVAFIDSLTGDLLGKYGIKMDAEK
jgi:outer membrane protein TolC